MTQCKRQVVNLTIVSHRQKSIIGICHAYAKDFFYKCTQFLNAKVAVI